MKSYIFALLLLAMVAAPVLAGDKDVSGMSVTLVSPVGPFVGDAVILEFAIFNNSGGDERHTSTEITLPACIVINSLGYYFAAGW